VLIDDSSTEYVALNPLVSVVIPVFNQPYELRRCLAALQRQTYPRRKFEVFVVDNGSDPPVGEGAALFGTCVSESRPGSYAARNRGVTASSGEVLAFTDADCIPADDWIESGVRAIRALNGMGLVGGRIEVIFQGGAPRTCAELFESVLGFEQERYIGCGFAATANLFTTRATMRHIGPFDARLMSGGDKEWGQRVHRCGLNQTYAADVRVAHFARHKISDLVRKTTRVAGGAQVLADRHGAGAASVLLNAARQLVQLDNVRRNWRHPRLATVSDLLKFAGTLWLIELVRAAECLRIHFGGQCRRT
jgi:glycosyltransferase involved in cell wall biosynthesis